MSGRRKTASPRTMTTPESSSARPSLRPPSAPPAMSTQSAANSDPDTTLWALDLSLALATSISAARATFLACSTVTRLAPSPGGGRITVPTGGISPSSWRRLKRWSPTGRAGKQCAGSGTVAVAYPTAVGFGRRNASGGQSSTAGRDRRAGGGGVAGLGLGMAAPAFLPAHTHRAIVLWNAICVCCLSD